MTIAGPPVESAELDAFREELERIIAGVPDADAGLPESPAEPDDLSHLDCAPDEQAEPESPPGRTTASAYHPTILDLPAGERPRERLREHGARYLSNAELIAILLRSGIAGENALSQATRLIAEFDGLAGLARAEYTEFCGVRGLSHAKSSQIMAALELGRRIASLAPEERSQISCPQDAANLLAADLELQAQENLVVLLLNTRNQVVARRTIYIGTVNSSAVRPAEVLRPAIRENAPSIIVAHNHPSGDPTPSPEDVSVTRDLAAAGKLMDIELLDHLVIGRGGRFTSLKEKGLGFEAT